jgi:hypothetical protein
MRLYTGCNRQTITDNTHRWNVPGRGLTPVSRSLLCLLSCRPLVTLLLLLP